MNFKQKLAYMGLGFLFASVSYILANLLGDVDAQGQQTVIDTIVCRKIAVVDAEGNPAIILRVDEDGGRVAVYGKDGKSRAALSIDEGGGRVVTTGKNGVVLSIHENGLHVATGSVKTEKAILPELRQQRSVVTTRPPFSSRVKTEKAILPKLSDSEVEALVRARLSYGVPGAWIGSAVSTTKDVRIKSVEIREWGNFNEAQKYWPVKIRVVGSAIAIGIVEMGRHNFDGTADFKFSKDDYGKWKVEYKNKYGRWQ